jgi:NADH:ubiquinone oxidoreductase subunit
MHYSVDSIPSEKDARKSQQWQKSHLPNLTGTEYAYLPTGHKDKGGERDKATGDYQPGNHNLIIIKKDFYAQKLS